MTGKKSTSDTIKEAADQDTGPGVTSAAAETTSRVEESAPAYIPFEEVVMRRLDELNAHVNLLTIQVMNMVGEDDSADLTARVAQLEAKIAALTA